MTSTDDLDGPLADLTITLRQAGERETMHRRRGGLVISVGGRNRMLELPFGATRIVGGRKAPADIVIDDASVSTQHFELTFEGPDLMLRDLGSTNGTWINGVRLESVALPIGMPFVVGRVPVVVERIAEVERPVSRDDRFGGLVGASTEMRELFALLARVAPTSIDVLVLGETGTGKELVVEAIHSHSARAQGPLVVLDCASLPPDLAESEINGHRKGAFTGATSDRAGCFEAAHGGTIFLDEVGELPLDLQPKLLRVLERREVRRIGETEPRPADVRVVAATHRDLRKMVAEGTFREDLFFRLSSFTLEIPPLRARMDDVERLADYFLQMASPDPAVKREVGSDALALLMQHAWSGNVRELRNVLKVAAQLSQLRVITAADLRIGGNPLNRAAPEEAGGGVGVLGPDGRVFTLEEARVAWMRSYFTRLLAHTDGNVSEAARLADIDRRQVQRWMGRLGVK